MRYIFPIEIQNTARLTCMCKPQWKYIICNIYSLTIPKILTRALTLRVSTLPSARHSTHLTPVVCAKKTVLHTRSQCVHPTLPRSKTSAYLNWKCVGWRATTPCTTQEVVLVSPNFKIISRYLSWRKRTKYTACLVNLVRKIGTWVS